MNWKDFALQLKMPVPAVSAALVLFLLLLTPGAAVGQKKPAVTKRKANQAKANQTRPVDELAKLREEFIKATKDYKASLERLLAIHEKNVLLSFLRSNGIPFLAFREAIPGTATGPHIHIGRPSHRY